MSDAVPTSSGLTSELLKLLNPTTLCLSNTVLGYFYVVLGALHIPGGEVGMVVPADPAAAVLQTSSPLLAFSRGRVG